MKKLRFILLYTFYLIASVLTILYVFFWIPFMHKLANTSTPPSNELPILQHIDKKTIKQLGRLETEKVSSFIHFSKSKDNGVIRVCALGDSFTYGNEVAQDQDYPTLLQRLFDQRGLSHVEVINFGTGWYGFHQAYIMWDLVARHFSCDYVLLGPWCFVPMRDTMFNHTELRSPYYLHSRYVLDSGNVRRIDVLGDTYKERFDHYFSFIPKWEYMLYDRNPPALLYALIPQGRTLRNPFYYYDGTMAEEAGATYKILLEKLTESNTYVVLGHEREEIVFIGKEIESENLSAIQFERKYSFPYHASKSHNSAWGNYVVAEQFYAQLVEHAPHELQILKTMDIEKITEFSKLPHKLPLYSYDKVEIHFGDFPIGVFKIASSWLNPQLGSGSSAAFKDTDIVSLLCLKNKEISFLDGVFISLPFELTADAEVFLRVRSSGELKKSLLGKVRLLDNHLNIGVVNIEGMYFSARHKLTFHGNKTVAPSHFAQKGSTVDVLVENTPVLQGKGGQKEIKLSLLKGEFRMIRPEMSHYIDINELDSSGIAYFTVNHFQDGVFRVPVARWEKIWEEIPRAEKVVKKIANNQKGQ